MGERETEIDRDRGEREERKRKKRAAENAETVGRRTDGCRAGRIESSIDCRVVGSHKQERHPRMKGMGERGMEAVILGSHSGACCHQRGGPNPVLCVHPGHQSGDW